MNRIQSIILMTAGSLLEFAGVLTLVTNEGTLVPKIDLGFSVPAVLPVEVQGFGLFLAGAGVTLLAVSNLR